MDLVELNGRLDEFRLPVFTEGKLNLVGQMSLITQAPRMLRSGKMPSPFPHKISGIKHVKRIFKRFADTRPVEKEALPAAGHH
jgi:hypothetical protein